MDGKVSSVQHHPLGMGVSCGAVTARCAPRDDTGSEGRRQFKTWHDRSVTLVPARQGEPHKYGRSHYDLPLIL